MHHESYPSNESILSCLQASRIHGISVFWKETIQEK
jgi:hypothetical protein